MAELSNREARCLLAWRGLDLEECLNFWGVGERCDIELHNIRRVVRALARKGFVSYQRGLFRDDGALAGAGYSLTEQGRALLAKLDEAES